MGKDLNTTGLKNSIGALKKSIDKYSSLQQTSNDLELLEVLRSGVIHNFEIAYEVCWKFMQRWLALNVSPNAVKGKFNKELYRIAASNAIIDDATAWFDFHETRNSTAHIYDDKIAADVMNKITQFLPYAEKFVEKVEKMEGE